jgi:hypothetical protein
MPFAIRKIDFLGIGAQKAGTTALHHYLNGHPELCLPSAKELHFFDNEHLMRKPRFYREPLYHTNFIACNQGRLKGEITPCYMFETNYVERFYAYNPELKLIVILRDPVHRAYSHWNMHHKNGTESRTFMQAIRDELTHGYRGKHDAYLHRGLYAKQLKNFLSYFSWDQVLILLQDDLMNQPQLTLNEIDRPLLSELKVNHRPTIIQFSDTMPNHLVKRLIDSLKRGELVYLKTGRRSSFKGCGNSLLGLFYIKILTLMKKVMWPLKLDIELRLNNGHDWVYLLILELEPFISDYYWDYDDGCFFYLKQHASKSILSDLST